MIKLNGVPIQIEDFPNGESRVNGPQIGGVIAASHFAQVVDFKFETNADLVNLVFVKRHMDSILFGARTVLRIWYMPYSRMDRSEGGSVFTLKYVADLINSLNFSKVIVVEPHSDVTMALLDRSEAVYPTVQLLSRVMDEVNFDPGRDYLFFPDAGAQKRYSKFIGGCRELVAFKKRDFKTGKIEGMELVGSIDDGGCNVLIVDDLCSYGGTFIGAAELLKKAQPFQALEVYLLVSHLENSVLNGKIFNDDGNGSSRLVDRIFATDSIFSKQDTTGKITIFELEGDVFTDA